MASGLHQKIDPCTSGRIFETTCVLYWKSWKCWDSESPMLWQCKGSVHNCHENIIKNLQVSAWPKQRRRTKQRCRWKPVKSTPIEMTRKGKRKHAKGGRKADQTIEPKVDSKRSSSFSVSNIFNTFWIQRHHNEEIPLVSKHTGLDWASSWQSSPRAWSWEAAQQRPVSQAAFWHVSSSHHCFVVSSFFIHRWILRNKNQSNANHAWAYDQVGARKRNGVVFGLVCQQQLESDIHRLKRPGSNRLELTTLKNQ